MFRNLIPLLILDLFRIKKGECYKNGGLQRKSLFFNIYASIFAHFLHFMIFSYVEQIEKLVFHVEIRIASIKNSMQCLLYILHHCSGHTEVVASRVKEKSAALNLKFILSFM